ncbi:hypothetical protein VNPA142037_54520 [Pseudomonas aeruginosa]|nr:hypothetical protein VNPA120840_48980 [Pseudomonas aeruginosa]GLF04946.1 hypothetical protein VNPA120889_51030 [Pseudomonas aeruginosa]GLF47358.1 hypothetical protein VNPA141752_40170 [Pseudomonas aeruginosa]GLF67655.1 hypothetical protein VNPA142037_54520 [Pseudomonas aeruginosa]
MGANRGYVDSNPAQGINTHRHDGANPAPRCGGQSGACAPYLWFVMEVSYLCRLHGIETVTLHDANETRKGH